jgi:hypothetical protein
MKKTNNRGVGRTPRSAPDALVRPLLIPWNMDLRGQAGQGTGRAHSGRAALSRAYAKN